MPVLHAPWVPGCNNSLCIEIQRMWNLKCTIVPVIIGATGIVTRSLKKNLETIPGKHSIDSLHKKAILGTSHIIRKVLQCEAWSLSGGDHRCFKRSTRKKCLWQETYISYNNNNNLPFQKFSNLHLSYLLELISLSPSWAAVCKTAFVEGMLTGDSRSWRWALPKVSREFLD